MSLRSDVVRALEALADPERARGMQRYMKSEMPFWGVPAVPLRRALREVFADHPLEDAEAWRAAVLELWRRAGRREERYAAIDLLHTRRYRRFADASTLSLGRELIVSGAWWDLVDAIASHHVGDLLKRFPADVRPQILAWSVDPDMWLRRTAIICQLGRRDQTDLALLYACIEPSLDSREFFLRKAIGWALRQYARTAPAEVRRYVKAHEAQLSGLSKREALKHL